MHASRWQSDPHVDVLRFHAKEHFAVRKGILAISKENYPALAII